MKRNVRADIEQAKRLMESKLWHCVHLHVKVDNASVYLSLTKDEAAQLEFALDAAQREIRRREDDRLNREIEELDRKYPNP